MPELSFRRQIGYTFGMLGWSIQINIISVMLIYFYVPPSNSGLSVLVPQTAILGIFTIMSFIAASGRLLDAITDPLIAYWSDRFEHPRGRRIPFMAVALIPATICCIGMFFPPSGQESLANAWWLTAAQAGFYLFMTIYIVPYNALLPELAPEGEEQVRLSVWLSFAFVLGVIISSQTPALGQWLFDEQWLPDKASALQWAIALQAILAGVYMVVPVLVVDERQLLQSSPMTLPPRLALRQILTNHNFFIFIAADFAYFVSLTLISGGLLYILKVLLGLEESIGGQVMGVLVLMSLLFYPVTGRLVHQVGKKKLILFSLLWQGALLAGIFFFGRIPLSPKVQIFGFAVLASLPAAFLGILPYAVIAEIAGRDARETGQQKEAMYFAIRNFSAKLGQTVGIMAFAILTRFGKDPGDDLGIRLAGVFGACLCLAAGMVFMKFREVND